MSYDKERADAYYLLSLHDIANGLDLSTMEAVLEDLELEEDYSACSGVFRAIDFAKNNSIKQIIQEYDETLERLADEVDGPTIEGKEQD